MITLAQCPQDPVSLPTERERREDRLQFLILYGLPKCGKTTALAALDSTLLLDLEEGTGGMSAMSVSCRSVLDLFSVRAQIEQEIKKNDGVMPYRRICIDSLTTLEEMALPLASHLYKTSAQGSSWREDMDILSLPHGAGYRWLRQAVLKTVWMFRPLCQTVILVGHIRDASLDKESSSLRVGDLDAVGKLGRILCSKADAVGYCYRKKNEFHITFRGEDLLAASRLHRLHNRDFLISRFNDEDGSLSFSWETIFPEGDEEKQEK